MEDTKALLHAAIDRIGDEHLDELHHVVQEFARKNGGAHGRDRAGREPDSPGPEANPAARQKGLLGRLSEIKIDAPEDFSMNWERYAGGGHLGE